VSAKQEMVIEDSEEACSDYVKVNNIFGESVSFKLVSAPIEEILIHTSSKVVGIAKIVNCHKPFSAFHMKMSNLEEFYVGEVNASSSSILYHHIRQVTIKKLINIDFWRNIFRLVHTPSFVEKVVYAILRFWKISSIIFMLNPVRVQSRLFIDNRKLVIVL
jgi:hypothetical protein